MRLRILPSCLLTPFILITALTSFSQTKQPNIILIVSDDHAYQAISAYGSKLIKTPNIDRIGKEGAVMQKGYVTNSVCSPSRAVMLTGKYSHINGLRDNGTFFDSTQQTFPKLLQQAGYKLRSLVNGTYGRSLPGSITGIFFLHRDIITSHHLLKWERIRRIPAM